MWTKLIFGLVLAAFASLQFVNSLTCYNCISPDDCRNPSTQVCSNATADATSRWLNTIHSNVPTVSGSNSFKCMNLTYYYQANLSKTHEYLGCYHPAISVCQLNVNATQGSTWSRGCSTCDWDKCNRNPAATFSKSTYTIMASAITLILVKFAV
ncbi:uncharacterized protein [Drosophila virilis]|uniref:Protein quiver n=1 Tax=Drosophila virilis TaxID=7244 RepID=B4LUZ9_DROVI|nr:uncharacterized protein LOC6627627 [Drosophila virilis]EDW63248.1 uncharacterized protein Dvir_GJ14382 [Drosophila virilis]